MHRSGTSFVASLLDAWNVRMGDALLPADRDNPAGYFEDTGFLELDRRILFACTPDEAGHRDWGWTESERFDDGALREFREEAVALVASRERGGGAWGWKDPRTTMLLDFWEDVLGGDARFLFVYRQPWEVADSMLRTGADLWLTHPGYPARIWTRYNRRILDFHRRHRERSLLVSTNRLLRDPESFAALVRERFGIEADANTFARWRREESFVSLPDDDPLPRLWQRTNAEAMELLGALDDAADLGNERAWEAATRKSARASSPRPRLSVILPCHDDGEYLIDAVASVERNAPADTELIIVDDGSTQPRTREVLAALRDAGHRVLEQPHSGLSAARNRGIAACTSEYVLPLDADNRLLPGFAADAMAVLDPDANAGVVYGDRREFGARTGDVIVPDLDPAQLLWSNSIDACAVMRRAVWSDVGGYDVAFAIWEDWDFWLGAMERGWRFVHLPRATFEYRVRPDSLERTFLRRKGYASALRQVYDKHRALVAQHASEILLAGHTERHQLFDDIAALRTSRDTIQTEIDRMARATHQAPAADPGPITRVFTIIARNYLAHARVLAASLARHNPDARLHVVVLDDPDHSISEDPSFEIVHADALPFDPPSDFFVMAAIYDVTELATAIKPWAFEHFFANGAEAVIYLDPDIEVFDSLADIASLAREHGMVLTPHVTEALPQDGKRPDERDLLLAGIYNLGFLALSAESTKAFLPWWCERLRRNCVNAPADGMFVDQRWMDFAPALFDPFILKDPGANVAYWNLPHRALTREGEQVFVDGQPLRFFHFSGFSPRTPQLLSKHQHASMRVSLNDDPVLAALCASYAAELEAAGFAVVQALPYAFTATANGLPLDARTRAVLRRSYLDDEAAHATSFPNPFSHEGDEDVVERLRRPSHDAPDVPAYLIEIWREREDLRLAFPRIESVDAKRFLHWVRTQGVREHEIPPQLVPRASTEEETRDVRAGELTPGVNVYGYAFAESGTGQIVRSVVAALAAEGIPYAVVPFTRTHSRQHRAFSDLGSAAPSFDTNLICVNADQVPLFFESMHAQLLPGARNIGLWAWEVDDLPAAMAASERYLDEVWGISSFTAAALARSLTKPVRAFPLPVVVPEVRRRTRAELGMPEGFLFLFCFDYDSVFRRKNPLAAVAAFQQAFGDRNDVVLFVKTTNAARHAAEHEALRMAAGRSANIIVRDAYVTSDDYFSMLGACDCYVSLHRSEGFGLTVAEAMALGKPVITTAYSATTEFANDANSYPVPARIVNVGDDAQPYPPQSHWAEPDVNVAAERMLRVHADRAGAQSIGARARMDIETLHGPSARGPLLRQLLGEHRGAPGGVPMETTAMEPHDPFAAEALAVEAMLGSPRPDLPSRMQRLMTPVRRFVLRAMRVYWVQQLAVDRALLAAMRTLRRESQNESVQLREQVAQLTEEVRALRKKLDRDTTRP